MKATVFAKLITLNVTEELKWCLRNQPLHRVGENLETLFEICHLPGDIQKKKKCTYIKHCHFLQPAT